MISLPNGDRFTQTSDIEKWLCDLHMIVRVSEIAKENQCCFPPYLILLFHILKELSKY